MNKNKDLENLIEEIYNFLENKEYINPQNAIFYQVNIKCYLVKLHKKRANIKKALLTEKSGLESFSIQSYIYDVEELITLIDKILGFNERITR